MNPADKSETPGGNPGAGLSARYAYELAQRDAHHAIDQSRVDGLGRQEPEQLVGTHAVPLTGVIKTPIAQASLHVTAKDVGSDAHPVILDINGQECQAPVKKAAGASVKPDRFDEFARWVDSKRAILQLNDGEPYSLESLSAPWCTGVAVAATDDWSAKNDLLAELDDYPSERERYVHHPAVLERFDLWWAQRPKLTEAECADISTFLLQLPVKTDLGSHVEIFWDCHAAAFTGSAPAFMSSYAKCLPIGWRDGVVIALTPGEPPRILRWSDKRVTFDETRQRCVDTRFQALAWAEFGPNTQRVLIPAPAPAPKSLAERKAEALAAIPAGGPVLSTGIRGIDGQFHPHIRGGFPLGSLVVLGGKKGAGKTTLAIHLAERARTAGYFVLWIAKDEQVHKIEQRLKQYRGEASEPPNFFVLSLGDETFEALAEQAVKEAGARPVLIVADSLQRMATRQSSGRSGESKVTAIVEDIAACQEHHPMIVVATSEIARGSGELKGSSTIDYLGTTCLLLTRSARTVAVSYLKNRDGSEEPFRLVLDPASQRMTEPGSAGRDIGAAIIAAVAELGTAASGAAIEDFVGGDCKTVRAELKALFSTGLLIKAGAGRATVYSVKPSTE